jgi:glycine betaine/choline ABC-type transport system substrate-binding protein
MKKLWLIMALLVICGLFAGCPGKRGSVVVGAKDFTEQYILGNMLTLLIEANTNLKTSYKSHLASDVLFAATRTGAVDMYVDYTGTVYGSYLKHSDTKSYNEVYDISARELKERFDLHMLDLLGFNNTFALAVRADTAEEHNLKTISDLARVSSDFIFGGHAEILNRYDGLPNLKIAYNMTFKEERVVDPIWRYHAIVDNEVQVIEVFSTDGMLIESNLVVLEDDKNFFPAYEGVIIIRGETVEKHPELLEALGRLAGLLTDDVVRDLNYMVDVMGEAPKDVAESFLKMNNLI